MSESPNVGSAGLDAAAADDAEAFNKGKGRTLAAMIACALLAIAAVAWLLTGDGAAAAYGELGKQVNGAKSQFFDGFLVCALPGTRTDELKSNEDLTSGLHQRGRAGARYGSHLRGKCLPLLKELGTKLRALPPNPELAAHTEGMAKAATRMAVGTEGFATHLEGLEGAYDEAAAAPELDAVTRGWFEFRKAHVEFNKALKALIGK